MTEHDDLYKLRVTAEAEADALVDDFINMLKMIMRICNSPVMTNSERINNIMEFVSKNIKDYQK